MTGRAVHPPKGVAGFCRGMNQPRALSLSDGIGIFIHRADSIYDDSPAERYQFPSQYLGRAEACVGDWIIYYEPRKVVETRGYFAVAKVQQIIPDLGA